MNQQRPPTALTMADLVAMVVGFAGAGYIYRETIADVSGFLGRPVVALLGFLWLGTTMAAPLVLGIRRLQYGRRHRMATGEKLWALLGTVWSGVLLAVALRAYDPILIANLACFGAAVAGALAPILLIAFWSTERKRLASASGYSWCHYGGLVCAAAWPLGWTITALLLGS